MFYPQYSIGPVLLANIKKIMALIMKLNGQIPPKPVLVVLEKKAREISAKASTSIEGNPLTLEQVRKLLHRRPPQIRDIEREVWNYNEALKVAHSLIHQGSPSLNLKLVLRLHVKIMDQLIARHRCGKLRTEPVFVNDPRRGEPVYLPPDHGDVKPLMGDLLKFVQKNSNTLDPLILAGLFHRQFVIIHPFMDGNGRAARLLTTLLLANMGLNFFTLFSFENYYNQNVARYFEKVGLLGNYYDLQKKIDFTEWLDYFTAGIIDELERISEELSHVVISPQTTLKPYHQAILDHIKKNGFITDQDYSRLTLRAKATRSLDFKKLLDMGLIERLGKGRATYYKLRLM